MNKLSVGTGFSYGRDVDDQPTVTAVTTVTGFDREHRADVIALAREVAKCQLRMIGVPTAAPVLNEQHREELFREETAVALTVRPPDATPTPEERDAAFHRSLDLVLRAAPLAKKGVGRDVDKAA